MTSLLLPIQLALIPLLNPPSDWEPAFPKDPSPYLQVAFLGKGTSDLRPSINLAIEETDATEKEYLKAAKALHLAEADTSWRDLGKFKTTAGTGRLTEIGKKLPTGEIKILQFILVQEGRAYLLTGAASRADYLQEQSRFFQTFRSFSLPPSLLSPLSAEAKEKFATLFAELGTDSEKEEWQRSVAELTPLMGKHWELLMLKEGLAKISASQ